MSEQKHFSDEELTAYLDGETDYAPVADIEAALVKDTALQQRLTQLTMGQDALKDGFDALLLAAPKPPAIPETVTSANDNDLSGPTFSLWQTAVAACVALVVGFGAANLSTPSKANGWMDYVAAYQALYTTATLSHVDQTVEAAQSELLRVTKAVDIDLSVENLSSFAKLDYKRAQILSYQGKPLIQLTFLTTDGQPIALCIIKTENGAVSKPDFSAMEGMKSASWQNKDFEFLLIGGDNSALIKEATEHFAKKI